jgi:diacylglycerol kinase (ATP)
VKGVVFLVNPAAGSGRAGDVWRGLVDSHPELERATVVRDADRAVAAGLLAGSLGDSVRALIAVGGDGTLHHAANALLAAGAGDRVALGVIPAGTGSDLARTLRIPDAPGAALQLALEAEPRPLDVIEVTRPGLPPIWCVNTASAGVSGVVVDAINRKHGPPSAPAKGDLTAEGPAADPGGPPPRRSGASYLLATVRALLGYRPPRARVAIDGQPIYEGPVFLLAVANGASFGKGMRVAPRAKPDDGLIDVVLVGDVPRWQLPLRLGQLYLGRHLSARPVTFRQARQVDFEPLEPFPSFELDGDGAPCGPARMQVLPGALKLLR